MTLEEIIAEAQARRFERAVYWREKHEALLLDLARLKLEGISCPPLQELADRCAGFAEHWGLEPAWTIHELEGAA